MPLGYLGALLAHPLSFPRPILARLRELEACLSPGLCVCLGVRAQAFSRRDPVSVPHSPTESSMENLCGGRSRSRGIARARRAPSESCPTGSRTLRNTTAHRGEGKVPSLRLPKDCASARDFFSGAVATSSRFILSK